MHLRMGIIRIDNLKGFAFVTVFHEPAVSASPGNLFKMQSLRPIPKFLNQKLVIQEILIHAKG